MPTPRPDTLVTFDAVEKPGMKMNFWICDSDSLSASDSDTRPRSIAFDLMRAASRPRPSSETSTMMWPPSCQAESRIVPFSGLPAARRSAGISRP